MLQKLHDNIKGWVASVVIGIICLAFILWGVQAYVGHEAAEGKTLATVSGQKITEKEVDQLYQKLQRQFSVRKGAVTSQVRKQLKIIALQRLVAQMALSQAAKKSGLYISNAQVEQVIMTIPQFKSQGRFSRQLFQQFLYSTGFTQSQFLNEIKTEMLIAQMAAGIRGSAFVLPSELEAYYNLIYQKRGFSYLVIPANKFASQVNISDKEAKSYYENNQQQFIEPERVSVSYLELSPEAISKTVVLSDKTLENYYQANQSNYRTPATWQVQRVTIPLVLNASQAQVGEARKKMEGLLAQIKKGTKFSALLAQYQGATEDLTENSSPQLLAQVKALKVNQISKPFNTAKGYTVIQLVKHTPATVQPFDKVKDKIRAMLVGEKVQQKLAALSDQLASLTYTNPGSLEAASNELHLKVQQSELFSRQGAKTGVASYPNVVEAAFSDEVLAQGNNSNPLTLKDGSIIVLRVNKHIKSKAKSFAEVKARILARLKQKTEQAKAALLAQSLQTQLQQGKTPEQVASDSQLHWRGREEVARTTPGIFPAILKAAFNLSMTKKGRVVNVALRDGDAALVILNKITQPDFAAASKKEKQELLEKLKQFFGTMTYQLYLSSVKQKAEINYTGDH